MTLKDLLSAQFANPADVASPKLYVSSGVLSDKEEAWVTSPEYGGLPYAYVLNLNDGEVQRYDNGSARFLTPVDVVFEARQETSERAIDLLHFGLREKCGLVDELSPGVPLATRFRYVGGYRAEARRKGFLESLVRLESTW